MQYTNASQNENLYGKQTEILTMKLNPVDNINKINI